MADIKPSSQKLKSRKTKTAPTQADHTLPVSSNLDLTQILLDWYDHNQRRLPWRSVGTELVDPYRIWLSEIMLQQTTVATVVPYFQEFLIHFPTLHDLAAADLDLVLRYWAGLGYYARARNMHVCARLIVNQYNGNFPKTEAALADLPGIGPYTAAAIAAIAFGQPSTVVDGNVERVIARLHAVLEPLPKAKEHLRHLASILTPRHRPGDYAQAIMDLGAMICTPRAPGCILCPWNKACAACQQGIATSFPVKKAKPRKPTRFGYAFWLVRPDGAVLIRRRPEKGLLGGMMEIPSSDWLENTDKEALQQMRRQVPITGIRWRVLPGKIQHSFTHFRLELTVLVGQAPSFTPIIEAHWCASEDLHKEALPSVMKKIITHACKRT